MLPPGVNFINIFLHSFFEAFLRIANCGLQMVTSTAKCNLRIAQPAQFLYEKAWSNSFSKTSSFFCLSHKKATCKHVDDIDTWQQKMTAVFPNCPFYQKKLNEFFCCKFHSFNWTVELVFALLKLATSYMFVWLNFKAIQFFLNKICQKLCKNQFIYWLSNPNSCLNVFVAKFLKEWKTHKIS